MTQMLELFDREFKAIVINMLKVLLEIVYNMYNQMGISAKTLKL